MTITEREVGPITVLGLSGKITSDQNGQLKETVTRLLDDGHKQIVLDLGEVTYIDSSGLGEIVSCDASASREKAAIRLANAGKRSRDLLVVTKLITVFDVYDTQAEAIASFVQPA